MGDRFTKDSQDSAGKKKKQLTITYCEERSSGRLRNFTEMIFSQLCRRFVSLTTNFQQNFLIIQELYKRPYCHFGEIKSGTGVTYEIMA